MAKSADLEIILRDTEEKFELATVSVGVAPCVFIAIGDPDKDEPMFKIDATGPGVDVEMVQSLLETVAHLMKVGQINE